MVFSEAPKPHWGGIQSFKAASGVGMQTWSAGGVLLWLPGTTVLFPHQPGGHVKGWWAEDKPDGFRCSITSRLEAASSGQGGEIHNTLPFSEASLPLSEPFSAPTGRRSCQRKISLCFSEAKR